MRWWGTGLFGLFVVLCSLIGPEPWVGQAWAATDNQITRPAQSVPAGPPFELVTFAGEAYSNDSLKGQPVLLVFWAPWCRVCQRELPLLGEFYRRDRPEPLRMVSIGFADTRTNVEQFVKGRADTFVFPTAYDEDRWVSQSFKINATPTYVLLDAQGTIALVHRGGGILQNPQFRNFLSTLSR